ncbi:hypothetical protein CU665_21145 [Pseudomonas syringae pv. actinidifoliorum]|nr:hypothetical protein [Pseudomonas syringae pv. actinidifoliorum]NAT39722.1 hypothetical protein [Pseudomonas syringae pv. actinidifoliorum]
MAQLTSVSAAKRQSPGQDSAGLKPARRPSHHVMLEYRLQAWLGACSALLYGPSHLPYNA